MKHNANAMHRKTGITVPDSGIRDENGLEPMDHLFSSPEKARDSTARKTNGARNMNATISSEAEMDVDESMSFLGESTRVNVNLVTGTMPEPNDVLSARRLASSRLPPPRAKTPLKTFLNSPARRNPSLGPQSSPIRGAIVESRAITTSAAPVRRKLDFSNTSFESHADIETSKAAPQPRSASELPAKSPAKLTTKKLLAPFRPVSPAVVNKEPEETVLEDSEMMDEDSFQMIDGGDDEAPEEEREESPAPEPVAQPTKKSKGKEKAVEEVSAPAGKRGRSKKVLQSVEKEVVDEVAISRPAKRARTSLDGPEPGKKKAGRPKKVTEPEPEQEAEIEQEALKPPKKSGRSKKAVEPEPEPEVEIVPEASEEEQRPVKRTRRSLDVPGAKAFKTTGKPEKTAVSKRPKESKGKEKTPEEPAPTTSKPRAKVPSKKSKLATISEAESPEIQRGPPMPRNNRGLFILRRETPSEGAGFKQTRSGRNSIKPLAYWRNERVEWADDENEDHFGKFMMPRIKEVVRAEEVHEPKRKVSRSKSKAPKSRSKTTEPESEEEDEEAEEWEQEPGRIYGDVKSWNPDDPSGAQSNDVAEEIALSSAAIITRPTGAGFKFAKTLTLPFFGSGFVDLPPKSMKKAKNSRKMQMVFFVFSGRVQVVVNDNIFGIGKGGMWQVPRGEICTLEIIHTR